jgi:hypothetical protein
MKTKAISSKLLVGNNYYVDNAFESIQTYNLTGSQASVTFSSIPSTYKHLQIRVISRSTRAGTGFDYLLAQVNGDTAANYSWHLLYGNGTTAAASASPSQASMGVGFNPQVSATTNSFGVTIIDILDYADTSKYKTIKSLVGSDTNDANGAVGITSGNWRSTSAITSITLFNNISGSLVQYSSFALYGIK